MQIKTSTKHFTLPAATHDYIELRAAKLRRIYDRIQEIECKVERIPNGYHVELRTDVEHRDDFIANASAHDLHEAIDLALDKAVRQLSDWKDLTRNRKHQSDAA